MIPKRAFRQKAISRIWRSLFVWDEEDWEGWFSSWQELHEVQQTPASYRQGLGWWLMIEMKRLLPIHEFCNGDLCLMLRFGTCLMTLRVEWPIAMMHGHPLVDVDNAMVCHRNPSRFEWIVTVDWGACCWGWKFATCGILVGSGWWAMWRGTVGK